ncbi:hypothetical protein L5515_016699 [Caenorhabditis briggsae]|uniref:Uncharacterized protein n=1 Tax=Caenorhabditis briggsae TaxID=6238 RepID=A0AAE9FCX3_CAEBR|nr:hypothetical protein L5515_016699 [Caenorhabditis briggsae]
MSGTKFRKKQNEDATFNNLHQNVDIEKVPVLSNAPYSKAQTPVPLSIESSASSSKAMFLPNFLTNPLMGKLSNLVPPGNQEVICTIITSPESAFKYQ